MTAPAKEGRGTLFSVAAEFVGPTGALMGRLLPKRRAADVESYNAMLPERRDILARRLEALEGWENDRAAWPIERAVEHSDLQSASRFYNFAALWADEEQRELELLGAYAGGPRKRGRRYDEALLGSIDAKAREIVEREGGKGFSVEKAITEIIEANPEAEEMPGRATIRLSVDVAKREFARTDVAGEDLLFDCCAVAIADEEGAPVKLYACIDKRTALILGFAVGDVADSIAGYVAAASDAKSRVENTPSGKIHWVERLDRMELVIGKDLKPFREWEALLKSKIRPVNPQGSNKHRRFGRYLTERIGPSIGRIALLPAQTDEDGKLPKNVGLEGHSPEIAWSRLEVEVVRHNRAIAEAWNDAEDSALPENLLSVLEAFSAV